MPLNFKTFCCNWKIRRVEAKLWVVFLLFWFWKELCFKVKEPMHFLSKNINFDNTGTESKMGNPTQSFRDMNLVLQLIQKKQIKSKTVMTWSSRKKKKSIFCIAYFAQRGFYFKICVWSRCIVYWIHFHNLYTFAY